MDVRIFIFSLIFVVTAATDTKAPTAVHARAMVTGLHGVQGVLNFTEYSDKPGVKITGRVEGLTPGKHGFHVHQYGDVFTQGCDSPGSHFNPKKAAHGGPGSDANSRHAGDLGNIVAGEDGIAMVDIFDEVVTLIPNCKEDTSIVGRGVVIHEKEDDLGRGENDNSKVAGNAGKRLACGIIGLSAN